MRFIIILTIFFISPSIYSYSGFDRMRCQGQLIEEGTSLEQVVSVCGDPIFEKEDKNDFRTLNYVTYKAEGVSSRYYLLFRNGSLELCKLKGYNSGDLIWINPETF